MIDKKFDCTISPGSRVVWENKRGWYIHLEIREIFNNRTAAVFISFTPEFRAAKTNSVDLDAPFEDVSGQEGANYKKQKTIDISVTVKEDALFHIINRGSKKRPWPATDLYIKVKSVKSESITFEVGQADRIGEACIIDAAAPKIKTDGRLPKSEKTDKKSLYTLRPGDRAVWENKDGEYVELRVLEPFQARQVIIALSFTKKLRAYKLWTSSKRAEIPAQPTGITDTYGEGGQFVLVDIDILRPFTALDVKVTSIGSEAISLECVQSDRLGIGRIVSGETKEKPKKKQSEEAQTLEVGAKQCENAQTYELSVKPAAFMASLIKFVNLTPKVLESFDKRIDEIENLIKKQSS